MIVWEACPSCPQRRSLTHMPLSPAPAASSRKSDHDGFLQQKIWVNPSWYSTLTHSYSAHSHTRTAQLYFLSTVWNMRSWSISVFCIAHAVESTGPPKTLNTLCTQRFSGLRQEQPQAPNENFSSFLRQHGGSVCHRLCSKGWRNRR